jgi:hypothetical protein
MTFKRKLGLAAVLVVALAVGLGVIICGRKSDLPIVTTLIEYERSNHVVIQFENKSGSAFFYSCSALPSTLIRQEGNRALDLYRKYDLLAPSETCRVSLALPPGEPARKVHLLFTKPRSRFGLLLGTTGIHLAQKSWETSIDLPPP